MPSRPAFWKPARRAIDRLLAMREIDPHTGCWLFTGYVLGADSQSRYASRAGYGYIRDDARGSGRARLVLVHRLAWRELVCGGKMPLLLEIDHLCQVRRCFNPAHLQAIDGALNRRLQGTRREPLPAPEKEIPF